MQKAEQVAAVLVNHLTNEQGQILAKVEENPGFQEVYDYRGGQKRQHRLDRKREEVAWNLNPTTHLFQKTYYTSGLTLDEEKSLRGHFHRLNASHEHRDTALAVGMFASFWPIAYKMSRVVRPSSLFLFAGVYWAGWQYGVQPMSLQMLQQQLNKEAEPIAKRM